jgi:hypothetical protein
MTEVPKAVRLIEQFYFYDSDHYASRQFLKGAIVTDQEAIAFLLQHSAKIERIEIEIEKESE